MHSHRFRTISAASLTVFALVVLATPAAAQQDLRSPDAREPATRISDARPGQDRRSPDARDAALISQGLLQQRTPNTIVVEHRVAAPAPTAGFEWLDAAIGAAVALGIALLGAAAVLAAR